MEAGKRIGQRIEVLPCTNAILRQRIKHLVTAGAKQFFIKHNREVCVIRLYFRLLHIQLQPIHTAQMLPIAFDNCLALCNLLVHVAQIAQTHRCAELVHLGIGTHSIHFFRAMNTKVLQFIQLTPQLGVLIADCTAFDGIEHLCSMKAEAGCITKVSDTLTLIGLTKGMSCIIQYLQLVLVCQPLDFLDIAYVAIHMHRNDSASTVSDQPFQLGHIHRICNRINITEHWL